MIQWLFPFLNSEDLDHGPVLNFPVAQMVEHGASNANIMGSIPRESKSWSNVKLYLNAM